MTTAADHLPPALVCTEWLFERLDDPDLRVIDATYFLPGAGRDARAEFAAAHIPGARFFDIDAVKDETSRLPHMLPSPEAFGEAMAALGIADGHQVVVYDTHGLFSAARLWWTFRVFGHDAVSVLDGGLPKWRAEGRPVTDAPPPIRRAYFSAGFRPELVRDWQAVRAALEEGAAQVVDARSAGRFAGSDPEVRPGLRSGHMPGAINLPFTDLLNPADKTLLDPDALQARLADAGIDPERPLVASCGSGVTACVIALALYRLGYAEAAVYDGSWTEWGGRDDLPVATGG